MSVFPGVQGLTRSNKYTFGASNGAIKASTGYAFLRVQEQVEAIVHGHSSVEGKSERLKCWFWLSVDGALLNLMSRKYPVDQYMFRLFKRWGFDRILNFLDEKTSPSETLLIMLKSPGMSLFPHGFGHLSHSKSYGVIFKKRRPN